MTVAITRTDLDAAAARSTDAAAARRMLALALALVMEGHSRIEAARAAGMDRQTLRDWVHRYNEGGLAGLHNAAARGRPSRRLTPDQEATVSTWVRQGPSRERHKVVRWRLVDLRDEIAQAFGVRLHEPTVGKLLARLNFAHVSARPHHPEQDVAIQETHKKLSRVGRRLHPRACPRQADRAVVAGRSTGRSAGQPDSLTCVWAEKGSRPRAPRDQRYEWAHLLGAVCPARGIGAALVLLEINTEAMNLHLAEISRCAAPGACGHQPRWRRLASDRRQAGCPRNIALLPLPRYSPELNPVENIWQFLRQNHLANRVFETYEAIVDACCDASNALAAAPETIRSIASRAWAEPVTP